MERQQYIPKVNDIVKLSEPLKGEEGFTFVVRGVLKGFPLCSLELEAEAQVPPYTMVQTSKIEPIYSFHVALTRPILNRYDARAFFDTLYMTGHTFHPEDSPADIWGDDGQPAFTGEEVTLLEERMNEVWEVMDDPNRYVDKLINR